MKLTQITVSYGATQSLPEYSNVKPNLTLTATLDDGDDPEQIEAQLWDMAKVAVHEQVDQALEASDQAAKYDPAPRYQVMRTYWNSYMTRGTPEPPKIVTILPNEVDPEKHFEAKLVHAGYRESRKLRYAHALRIASQSASELGAALIDCSDGDLTPLIEALKAEEAAAPAEPIAYGPPVDDADDAYREIDDEDDDDDDDEELDADAEEAERAHEMSKDPL